MHVGSLERGGSADQADRRLGLAEIPLAGGFMDGWDGGIPPVDQKNVAQDPVNRFKLLGGDRFHISREDYRMRRTVILGVALAFGLATVAGAAVTPAQVGNANSLVIRTAEGCGPGFWRGPGGKCHPMFDGRACPPGYHIGPEHKKCWPN
jgi:hypothetical protein